MALLKRITAIGIGLSMLAGTLQVCNVTAADTKQHDYSIGETVTYYAAGDAINTTDALIADQWALYNDGSFTLKSGENDFDVYDDPFGSPSTPGHWGGPFGRGFFSGFGSKEKTSSAQPRAVAGIDINIGEAWKKYSENTEAREVIVAVIDTGIDYSHEDLKDSIWVNEDEIPDNGIDDDGNGYIDDVYGWNFYNNSNVVYTGKNDDHGTHCAGTIAASTDNGTGVASVTGGGSVKVMVLKVLGGSNGTGANLSVIQAIRYAQANGASIVNLSLGSTSSDELLYNTIAASPMLFVVAAGNGNSYTGDGYNMDRTPWYPAAYDLDNIISVANISCDGNLNSSSNYGAETVDIAAPGTYIISTTPNNGYGYMTGTSMSTPFVTAAAALTYSYFKDITLKDVKTILIKSAHKLDSLKDKMVSGGMLDVGAALNYDITKLKHKKFKVKTPAGTAPELSYNAYSQNGRIHLTVNVNDADNDIYGLYYMDGEHNAEDFGYGLNGRGVTLRRSSTANLTAKDYGTYTFYALDKAGHEAVLVVKMTKDNVEERAADSKNNGYSSGWYFDYGRDWYSDFFGDWYSDYDRYSDLLSDWGIDISRFMF